MMTKALVLFSGGQDSTTCLAWALDRFEHVETIGFDYGQRHRIELDARARIRERLIAPAFPHWAGRLGEDHMIDLAVLGSDFSDGDDARNRDRHAGERPAEYFRARPQPDVPDFRRGGRLSPRPRRISSAACARRIIPAIPIAATTR